MNRRCMTLAFAVTLAIPAAARAQVPCALNTSDPLGFLALPGRLAVGPALAVPTVTVCANNVLYQIAGVIQRGNLAVLPTTIIDIGNGASFTVSAAFDGDPFSNFTFGSVLPAGFGPISFDAYFTTGVVPGAYTSATSSGTLGVTATANAGASATGTVTAGTYPFYISGYGDATNLGVDTGSGTCTVTTSTSNSMSCPPPGASNTFAPISPAFLTARLSYTHNTTGSGSSTVGFTGGVTLDATAVPEPATIALTATGMLLIGGLGLRRRLQS